MADSSGGQKGFSKKRSVPPRKARSATDPWPCAVITMMGTATVSGLPRTDSSISHRSTVGSADVEKDQIRLRVGQHLERLFSVLGELDYGPTWLEDLAAQMPRRLR